MVWTQVEPVVIRVLRNEVNFLHAIRNECSGFRYDIGLVPAAMRAAHAWNNAEAARMIAAFRDFQICEMPRRQAESRCAEIGNEGRALSDFKEGRIAYCVWREGGLGVAEFFWELSGIRAPLHAHRYESSEARNPRRIFDSSVSQKLSFTES